MNNNRTIRRPSNLFDADIKTSASPISEERPNETKRIKLQTERIDVALPRETKARLRRYAEAEGLTLTDAVRRLIGTINDGVDQDEISASVSGVRRELDEMHGLIETMFEFMVQSQMMVFQHLPEPDDASGEKSRQVGQRRFGRLYEGMRKNRESGVYVHHQLRDDR